jgi:hypothetical protein
MALYLISYDVAKEDAPEYEALWQHLRTIGAKKILYSEWAVVAGNGQARAIYDRIAPLTRLPDRLLVQELTNEAVWDKLLIPDAEFQAMCRSARG